jgi:hypothetical protein
VAPLVAAPCTSITATTVPSATSSLSLTRISFTTPATLDGTSIVALSDSSVTRPWSLATLSPGLTRISMTGTPLRSPMSGTLISIVLAMGPYRRWGVRRFYRRKRVNRE